MQVKQFKMAGAQALPYKWSHDEKYYSQYRFVQLNSKFICAAMQKVELAPSYEYLEVTDIKPFGAPFTHVPRIVFANPPHRILKLTDESCATIRKAAQTVTHEQIRSSVRKQNAAQPLSSDAFVAKCLEAAESYDWMNAMNYINDHLQDRS